MPHGGSHRAEQTNVGGKPIDKSLFTVSQEEMDLRAQGDASREAKEYADYLARNSVAAGASGPGSVAGSNAAQVAAPYNLEPGLMSGTLENTYASSRVPGRGGRQGGRNDVDRRQPGKDGRRGGIPFEGGKTYEERRAGGYAGYEQMNPLHPDNAGLLNQPQDQETKSPTDPFSSGLTDLQNQRKGMYEDMFANQEGFAQDKYDSIKDYLGTMDAERQEQYQADMANIGQMYNERREQRDQRFDKARSGAGNRESLALDTLADLGITPNRETFDPVTGSTQDMLFSQQQSGADMLNTMSFISNQMLDFTNTESGRNISAGLQQAEMHLAEEMANIQFARDSQAISDIEAAIAQEKATAAANAALARAQEAEEAENQRMITAGQYFGVTDPAEAVALFRTGTMGPVIDSIFNAQQQDPALMYPTEQWGEIPLSTQQAISAGLIGPPSATPPQMYQDPETGFMVPVESPGDLQTVTEIQALR